ncbi:MAG: helix-turn-helix domain-containing protein [Candidatus Bipolaricaulis sp.]|nr:helix-turn-helix domain-containing protein [Candidatus Bipolaricaulis sp.]
MTNYLLQVKDEESFFQKVRKIVKEELSYSKNPQTDSKSQIPYIKVEEVMRILNVSRPTVNEWARQGYFKKYKINSRVFYNRDEIMNFISKQNSPNLL